jgi:Immunoglobulin domain
MKHKSSFDLVFPGLLRRQENASSSELCGRKPEIKISSTMKTGLSAFGCYNQVAASDSAPTHKTLKPAASWPARAWHGPERRTSGHRAAVLALAVSTALCGNVARADSYSISIPQGLSLIANQLDHGSNTTNEVFANVPDGCVLSKYNNDSGTWSSSCFGAGAWMPDTLTLSPGEGAYLQSPTNFTLTFTGTPHVPVLPVSISPGHLYLLSRQTNDIGTWDNIVGTDPEDSTLAYTYNGSFRVYQFSSDFGGWYPAPSVPVGSALWIRTPGGADNLYPPPFITQQPMSVSATQGQTTTFTVSATGAPPLSYQWCFNLTNILSGAINATYTVFNAQSYDAGAYDVVVSNPGGSVTSQVATLRLWQSYTINLPGGGNGIFYLIANQLDHGSNTLDEVLPNMPDGTQILTWNCSLQGL